MMLKINNVGLKIWFIGNKPAHQHKAMVKVLEKGSDAKLMLNKC